MLDSFVLVKNNSGANKMLKVRSPKHADNIHSGVEAVEMSHDDCPKPPACDKSFGLSVLAIEPKRNLKEKAGPTEKKRKPGFDCFTTRSLPRGPGMGGRMGTN